MTEPLILTTLRSKQAEIVAQIKSLEARLFEAKADLAHVAAVVRLFDPQASERPARSYHSATKALKRSDLFELCRAALQASDEPLCTRQLARHVIAERSWDTDDRRLRLATAHKVGSVMARFEARGLVQNVGMRQRATLWLLS